MRAGGDEPRQPLRLRPRERLARAARGRNGLNFILTREAMIDKDVHMIRAQRF